MKNIAMAALLLLSLTACHSHSHNDHQGHDHERHGQHGDDHPHDESFPSDTMQESFSLPADSSAQAPLTP
jgi:hypothetical protein